MKIPYIIYEQEGGFVAESIGDIVLASEGETFEEAKAMFQEAVEVYLEAEKIEKNIPPKIHFNVLELSV